MLGRIVILGRGRVGRALHAAIEDALSAAEKKQRRKKGKASKRAVRTSVRLLRGSNPAPVRADTIVLAVPDPSLAYVALSLSGRGRVRPMFLDAPPVVLHVSGLRDARVLQPLSDARLAVGAMHPLASFAAAAHPPTLRGASFAISASRNAANKRALELVALLGGTPLTSSGRATGRAHEGALQSAAYHAAAALLANGAAALAHHASSVLGELGVAPKARRAALAGLLRSVAENVGALGTVEALTGPIARGDAAAVALHLRSLRAAERAVYAAVAPAILSVAVEAGLGAVQARAIRRVLKSEAPRA